jgi:ribonucleoside-diphosphate reductase alpha chain
MSTTRIDASLRATPRSSVVSEDEGYRIEHFFTKPGVHPYDEIVWEQRTASIASSGGQVVFEQKDVEIPDFWSQLATNVVVSKYFRGQNGTPQRERSVKQLVSRVADTITEWGKTGGYLRDEEAPIFNAELAHLLVYQKAAFNSPVWFNVGVREKPQCSACFILSVEDTMESILDWIKKEGMIFKHGSGSGINLSTLRSSKERLSLGGTASGPVSFMRGADASAGAIKSGGTTRRAAKMVVLNIDHPDIVEFVRSKELEEKKAWALGAMGYDMGLNGEAWQSIQFQNANNSVRVTDEFMRAYEADGDFSTRASTTGEAVETFKARDLMKMIADAAWVCGDPGMQYDTTINAWHTCPNTGRINASNPCSEYMHIDNSACNLASINLLKFVRTDGQFDVIGFRRAVEILLLAQEIIVGFSSYPTPEITRNAIDYRQLGLGYANLGALLMDRGLPYDSDEGRSYAAAITALMTGTAYEMSARIASRVGPFAGFMKNREPMLGVILKHQAAIRDIDAPAVAQDLMEAAYEVWASALTLGEQFGYRNSQATVLAPTGTIAFMMDCDTTGVEPDIALVKYKTLVGGGMMKIVNRTLPAGLRRLGYSEEQIKEMVEYVNEQETIEGAPYLKEADLAVFGCAFKPVNGERSIHYQGHIKMMGAVQPFISGAISKTVNIPETSTSEEIAEMYYEAWKLGVKALAIYRDGSKKTQPLNTGKKKEAAQTVSIEADVSVSVTEDPSLRRHKLKDTRRAVTHKFTIAGHEGYVTVGLYDDGQPGEVFLTMNKEGSTISGLMDAFATMVSVSLQYGVPLKDLVRKFSHMRFEPSGFTRNEDIPIAKSVIDYIFRWLGMNFLSAADQVEAGLTAQPTAATEVVGEMKTAILPQTKAVPVMQDTSGQVVINEHFTVRVQGDAPTCADCGSLMVRNGACYKCWNCGSTSGCS